MVEKMAGVVLPAPQEASDLLRELRTPELEIDKEESNMPRYIAVTSTICSVPFGIFDVGSIACILLLPIISCLF